MTDIDLYNTAIKFLLSFKSIKKHDLDIQLIPEHDKPKDFKRIYRGLCMSAQNTQMSPKVIGGTIGGVDNLKHVLYDFNPHLTAKNYAKKDANKLLLTIEEKLKPKGKFRQTAKSLWPRYCQSVIDSAHFLNSFETPDSFYDWTEKFAKDDKAKYGLPLIISMEITGIGFPLACDFLKELGFYEYGKPDVQLKGIFKDLEMIDPNTKSESKRDYETLKVIDRIAKANKVTPYAVDKVFWLIGSGDFYVTKKHIGKNKEAFIGLVKGKTISTNKKK